MLFKRQSLGRVDSFIIIICIMCATASSGWLIHDVLFNKFDIKGNVPIGKITIVKNHVKRKFNRSMIWYDAGQQEVVYENDWVFTGSESEATIVLDDGGELLVDPDSLIVLSRTNGALKLNLQHGSMIANVSKNVEVNILQDGQLRKVDVKKDTRITRKKTKPAAKPIAQTKDEIIIKEPADFETLWVDENHEGTLVWEDVDGINEYKIELSESEDFAQPISHNYTKNSAKLKLPSNSKKLYWRVSDSANPQVASQVHSFDVKMNTPPVSALNIGDGEVLELTSHNGEVTPASLKWTDNFNSWNSYDVQISKSSTFDKILAEGSSTDTLYNFKPEESGVYYWRIRGLDETGTMISAWSDPQTLDILIKEAAKKEIQLVKNDIIVKVRKSDFAKIKADKTLDLSKRKKKLLIQWKTDFPAPSYRVQISRTRDFKDTYEDAVSKTKKKSFNSVPLGISYYRIIVENKKGQANFVSKTGQIITYYPKVTGLKNKMEEYSNSMSWKPQPGVDTYQVRYVDEKGATAKSEFVSTPSLKLQNDGKYLQWRVRAVDTPTKKPISDYAKAKTDDWKLKKPRKTPIASVKPKVPGKYFPVITSPSKRKTFVTINNNPIFFVLKWKYGQKADSYEVEISKTEDMSQIVFSKKVRRKKRVTVNKSFKTGKYYMRVRAHRRGTIPAWSDVEVFRVLDQ